MRTKKLNNKGFTLVEVIVVAVIVAVLALVGIQLYQGYVQDARQSTAEHLAASAASFLATERSRGTTLTGTWGGGETVTASSTTAGVSEVSFTVPSNSSVTVNYTSGTDLSQGGTVSATTNGTPSTGTYKF